MSHAPRSLRNLIIGVAILAGATSCKHGTGNKTMGTTDTPSETTLPTASDAVYVPPAPQALVFPQEAFRSTQPAATPERPFQLPAINKFRLKSGITVYLIEQHNLPLISIDLEFDGGSLAEPADKRGLSGICMQALTEGTKTRDTLAFSEAVADIAAQISGYAGRETMGLSLDILTTQFPAGIELFADALQNPAFAPADMERLLTRAKEGIKQSKGAPDRIAGRIGAGLVMGRQNPLAAFATEKTIGAITPEDCVAFHQTWLKPGKANLFVVGDLTEAQVRGAFENERLATFSGSGTAPKLPAAKPVAMPASTMYFVHVPGAAQSQISFSHLGPRRQAKDYLATSIASAIIGGAFSSRLNMNLREDKGYAYGARGGFSYFRGLGRYSAAASVRADATYQSLVEMQNELTGFSSGKAAIKADEFAREKSSEIFGFPGRFETGRAALGMYSTLVYFGLPLDTYNSYTLRLADLTVASVAKAAKTHLTPQAAVILVVGDGDAPMKRRVDGKDVAWEIDGKPVTLRAALALAAKNGSLGKRTLVELDADGAPVTSVK